MDEWIPIDRFLKVTNTSHALLKSRLYKKQWHDGFVVKKEGGRWRYGSMSQYELWYSTIYRVHKKRI